MVPKILIIGNTSEIYHLGSMLVRAAQALDVSVVTRDIGGKTYSPSLNHLWGKMFYKLSDKRPVEWWSFNRETARLILEARPTLIVVTGLLPLSKPVFTAAHEVGATITNYLTDSPWNLRNGSASFFRNLPLYDWIFSTKTSLLAKLREAGAKQVEFLPFAFDPTLHHVPLESVEPAHFPDVCLIGAADGGRVQLVKQFLPHFSGHLGLYGGYWNKDPQLKEFYRGIVLREAFCQTVHGTRINIGLVRVANGDGHSMRSYEIPACGGLGIYQDTVEHRDMFKDYPDYGFFNSPQDLAQKCEWLLKKTVEQEEMRKLSMALVANDCNSYTARLGQILAVVS
jgi:spore maturation protein CgeB